MKNRKSKNGRMTASGVAAASPFDALSFSEYSESSSVASECACLAERSDATCSKTATQFYGCTESCFEKEKVYELMLAHTLFCYYLSLCRKTEAISTLYTISISRSFPVTL